MCALKNLCTGFLCNVKSGTVLGVLGLVIYVPIFFANVCAFFYHKKLSTLMPHITNMIVLICILGMLLFFANIFVQILLIYGGSSQKTHMELVPWLVINILSIVYSIMICFIALCSKTYIGEFFGIGVPIIGLQFYLWICVFTIYKRLEEDEKDLHSREPEISVVTSHEFINSGYNYSNIVDCD